MRPIFIFSILLFILSCNSKEQNQTSLDVDSIKQIYLKKGEEIAVKTQTELLANVSQAMKKGGSGYAIEFCNINALALKDSLSQLYNCQIKRIALKYRNPIDMPQTEQEKEQLNRYQEDFQKGNLLQHNVYLFDNRIEYYKPIMITKDACLKCHGDPNNQIANETMEKIRERYPNDLATGFLLNDFRGSWKITFDRQQ